MAGFYCRPLTGSPDNVCCFVCSKNLDGWQPEDEAWAEHVAHGRHGCYLVNLQEEVNRTDTFRASRWPHSSPGAEQMARAGFFYYPRLSGDDTAFCHQCGLALDGWEPTDDPWHEHSRRRPQCPFIATKRFVEPAAFQRILGSSSQPYVKEVSPGNPQRQSDDSKENQVEPEKKTKRKSDPEETTESASKILPPPSAFAKPPPIRQTMDVQKRRVQEHKAQEAECKRREQFIADLLVQEHSLFGEADMSLTVEDFVLDLVKRQLVSFDVQSSP
jgi:hypothetical protein